jgi:hypothetical protein
VQITIPGGLFGAGGFDPVALQRQAEERGRAEREYQAAEAAKLAALKEEVAERNRLQAEADAAKAAQVQPANISTYYDALRTGEDTSQFDDILQSTLAEQDYITSGFDMAEAGAYAAPVDDRFIVPGGIDTSNVGEFAFDKTLEDFEGYDFDYGNISNENLKKFQEELMPAMAPAVAQAQLEGQSYQNALIQAYERSPEVQEIYAKYDISPQRVSKKYGSEYLYDPFTFSEIQTVDRSPGTSEAIKTAALVTAGLFMPGAAITGLGQGAVSTAAGKALTSAAVAGATGGDPLKAALTSGINSGLGILEAQAPALYNDVEFVYNVAKGRPGLALLNKGLNVIEDGEITGTTTVGKKFTTDALNNVGLTTDTLAEYNINQSDLVPALVEVEKELIKGKDFKDSLRSGLIEYVQQGGGVPDLGINFGIALEKPEFLSAIAKAIRELGSAFDDAVLQPPKEAIEALYEAIPKPDVSLPKVDVPLPKVDVALPKVDVDLPEVDAELPEVDVEIPEVDLPSLSLPNIPFGLAISQPEPTKGITEDLFEDFLFEKKYQSPELLEAALPLDILRRTI